MMYNGSSVHVGEGDIGFAHDVIKLINDMSEPRRLSLILSKTLTFVRAVIVL